MCKKVPGLMLTAPLDKKKLKVWRTRQLHSRIQVKFRQFSPKNWHFAKYGDCNTKHSQVANSSHQTLSPRMLPLHGTGRPSSRDLGELVSENKENKFPEGKENLRLVSL